MKQLTGSELKEAHMALERGGVVIDAVELKRLLAFKEVSAAYEKRIAKMEKKIASHERALKKARKVIGELKGSE